MPSPTTDSLIIEVPTPSDFKGLAIMKAAAFAEKGVMNSDGGNSYDKYLKKYPNKIQRCRVAKMSPSSEGGPSEIMGAIQLQIKGIREILTCRPLCDTKRTQVKSMLSSLQLIPIIQEKGSVRSFFNGLKHTATKIAIFNISPWR